MFDDPARIPFWDVCIRVGESIGGATRPLYAHKHILASASGFFRGMLESQPARSDFVIADDVMEQSGLTYAALSSLLPLLYDEEALPGVDDFKGTSGAGWYSALVDVTDFLDIQPLVMYRVLHKCHICHLRDARIASSSCMFCEKHVDAPFVHGTVAASRKLLAMLNVLHEGHGKTAGVASAAAVSMLVDRLAMLPPQCNDVLRAFDEILITADTVMYLSTVDAGTVFRALPLDCRTTRFDVCSRMMEPWTFGMWEGARPLPGTSDTDVRKWGGVVRPAGTFKRIAERLYKNSICEFSYGRLVYCTHQPDQL